MVHGVKRLKEYFKSLNKKALIGRTACNILMDELGAPFRATKDFDMASFLELTRSFYTQQKELN